MTTPALSTVGSAFGPLVSGDDVGDHLQELLDRWLPSYLYEVERKYGVQPGTLPLPRSVVRSHEIEKFPEDQLPCLIIACPGVAEPPEADGAGIYSATWQFELGIEIAAGPARRALELASWYQLALRACVVQQQQDPALTSPLRLVRLDWRAERPDTLDSDSDRTVCVGVVYVSVTVAEVLRTPGPLDPLIAPQPPGPTSPVWPTAQTVTTDVERAPIEEDL